MKKAIFLSVIFALSHSVNAETKKCDIKGDKNVACNTVKNLTREFI